MSKKILVVEDEKNIAELERDYLEANGYTVEIEFDGKSGLDKALGADYDLVILDVMLPGLDGFEVCRQIRKHKECPVLMVSAKKDEIDKMRTRYRRGRLYNQTVQPLRACRARHGAHFPL